jgi:hypothetical protein
MSKRSLEDLLAGVDSPVELLRNSQAGPNAYPGVPAEYTNWRDEQTAWQHTPSEQDSWSRPRLLRPCEMSS